MGRSWQSEIDNKNTKICAEYKNKNKNSQLKINLTPPPSPPSPAPFLRGAQSALATESDEETERKRIGWVKRGTPNLVKIFRDCVWSAIHRKWITNSAFQLFFHSLFLSLYSSCSSFVQYSILQSTHFANCTHHNIYYVRRGGRSSSSSTDNSTSHRLCKYRRFAIRTYWNRIISIDFILYGLYLFTPCAKP